MLDHLFHSTAGHSGHQFPFLKTGAASFREVLAAPLTFPRGFLADLSAREEPRVGKPGGSLAGRPPPSGGRAFSRTFPD
jgi:hypothetical protein